MTNKSKKSVFGFTLVEVLIAVALFTTLSFLALNIFVNSTRMQSRIALESALNEDSIYLMNRIGDLIDSTSIDYEEYFNKVFGQGGVRNYYGKLYTCYAAQFYNPGKRPGGGADDLGAYCGIDNVEAEGNNANCVIYKPSLDINTGENPYLGLVGGTPDNVSAFCADSSTLAGSLTECTGNQNFTQNELYLISPDGKQKIILAKRKVRDINGKSEYAVGLLKLNGEDSNGDGIFEKWRDCASGTKKFCCAENYDCNLNNSDNLEDTLTKYYSSEAETYKGFIPMNSLRGNITRLTFEVRPLEDSKKAFAETEALDPAKIVVSISMKPSQEMIKNYGGEPNNLPEITLTQEFVPGNSLEVFSYTGNKPVGCP